MGDSADGHEHPVEFQPFWHSLDEGRISFPYCDPCHRFLWYPMKLCPGCTRPPSEWRAVTGTGWLHSWTVVRRAFAPEYTAEVPYIIGLVEFADAPGVRLVARIENTPLDTLATNLPVEPVIATDPDRPPPLTFRRAVECSPERRPT